MGPATQPENVERFLDLVAQRFGLSFEDSKRDYLADVLQERVRCTGSTDAGDYLQLDVRRFA